MRSFVVAFVLLLAASVQAAEVTFTFAPTQPVESVSVRGSFNDWGETPMEKQADGTWSVTVDVPPGEHQYKYYVDGQWPSDMETGLDGGPMDPDAEGYAGDGFGGQNAVRTIGGTAPPPPSLPEVGARPEDHLRVHYLRPDGRYDGWGLHVWQDTTADVAWDRPLEPTGRDDQGVVWDVPLSDAPEQVGLIVHKGDEKDPGPDQFVDVSEGLREVWIVSGRENVFEERPDLGALPTGDLGRREAHWVDATTIVWPGLPPRAESHALHHDPDGALVLETDGIRGGESIPLRRDGTYDDPTGRFPHLVGDAVLRIDDRERAIGFLRGRVAVSATDADGEIAGATGLQIPGVLDDLYFFDGPLGVTWDGDRPTLSVWAPTAKQVRLLLFDGPRTARETRTVEMQLDGGVWSVTGQRDWKNLYYLYEVTVYAPSTERVEVNRVTDPYSRALSANSTRSQIVDLDDPSWQPEGWDAMTKRPFDAFEDIALYELHIRDFSTADERVDADLRGTYLAFTQDGYGRRHLRSLSEAGITHVHLLPTFDIATVPELAEDRVEPGDLSGLPPDSDEQQAAITRVRSRDSFNWGYDPWHFGVPEGSYATEPDGGARLLEFRRMVKALDELDLRVVMDVVYNHTHASGQSPVSVFDRIVPGYYHRLDERGNVHTSTCCQNTASEHLMMQKFMVDDVVHWATNHRIDGFRFDLMGHHMKSDMVAVRDALRSLTVEEHGVDGSKIYVYGEGWDFGEVQGNQRGMNATQPNMAGTGIGTFNDRIRDAVRGGSPFSDRREQGYATGLGVMPNGMPGSDDLGRLRDLADRVRAGLAGNLRDFRFGNRRGGQLGAYALDPQESIQYVSAHDNETLFDKVQLSAPRTASIDERVAMHQFALGIVTMAQGVPFFHAGGELLRSKSMDADSYDSGDWFNRLDFSGATTTWGAGLPPAEKNRDRWDIMRPLLADPDLVPTSEHILDTAGFFRRMLRVRFGSPLFRLRTADEIQQRVLFPSTEAPGLIAMHVLDVGEGVEDLDPDVRQLLVLFNPDREEATFGDGRWTRFDMQLHPEVDAGVGSFDRDTGTFTVAPHGIAVFVEPQ